MKSTGSVNVEIIATGDELIYGRILDTNSHWISKRVAEMGAHLRRVTMIGDEPELIASTLNEALLRDAHFIVITGGLGPSEDDKTVDSIGLALNLETIIDMEGAEKIEESYRRRGNTDPAQIARGRRMARVLEGSKPMQNPVGYAIGMAIEVAGKTVCTLPGVPDEMKGMFNAHVAPMIESESTSIFLAKTYNISMVWREFFPIYREMQLKYPDIYIKNAATPPVEGEKRDRTHTIKVDFVLEAPSLPEAQQKMKDFLADYRSRIEAVGGGRMDLIADN